MALNYSTVKETEKKEEVVLSLKDTGFVKKPGTRGPVVLSRVKDFTCPACGKLLSEVVSINGKVRGWCGVKHEYVVG